MTLFNNLLKNAQFRRQFITAFCLMGGSVFESSRASAVIDSLTAISGPAMAITGESPYATANTLKRSLASRCGQMVTALGNYAPMLLTDTPAQRATLASSVAGARLELNGLDVPTGRFDGYLFAPVRLKAVAPAGYAFSGWMDSAGSSISKEQEIDLPNGTVALTACYEPVAPSEAVAPVRVNEVSAANDSYVNDYGKKADWVDSTTPPTRSRTWRACISPTTPRASPHAASPPMPAEPPRA